MVDECWVHDAMSDRVRYYWQGEILIKPLTGTTCTCIYFIITCKPVLVFIVCKNALFLCYYACTCVGLLMLLVSVQIAVSITIGLVTVTVKTKACPPLVKVGSLQVH